MRCLQIDIGPYHGRERYVISNAIAKFHNGYAAVMCYLKEVISTLGLLGEWFRSTGPVRSHHNTLFMMVTTLPSASHPP